MPNNKSDADTFLERVLAEPSPEVASATVNPVRSAVEIAMDKYFGVEVSDSNDAISTNGNATDDSL